MSARRSSNSGSHAPTPLRRSACWAIERARSSSRSGRSPTCRRSKKAVLRPRNVVTDEYQGNFSVKLNRTTSIEELDEEIEVGDDSVEAEGALVDIQSGSGLIKRCPEDGCTRVLQNGRCNEHGNVEGEFDLRIKGVLDDGEDVTEVIFDEDVTEELTGIALEEPKEMAMDALDTTVVADEMRQELLGRYYRVRGPTFGRYVLADEQDRLTGAVDADADPHQSEVDLNGEYTNPRGRTASVRREFNDASYTFKESDDDRAPVYVLLPTGQRDNRVFRSAPSPRPRMSARTASAGRDESSTPTATRSSRTPGSTSPTRRRCCANWSRRPTSLSSASHAPTRPTRAK